VGVPPKGGASLLPNILEGSLDKSSEKNIKDFQAYCEEQGLKMISFPGAGIHLRAGEYDFWPKSGKYHNRKTGERGIGLQAIQAEPKQKEPDVFSLLRDYLALSKTLKEHELVVGRAFFFGYEAAKTGRVDSDDNQNHP
jgi:hypothetical protein